MYKMHLPEATLFTEQVIGKLKPLNGGNLAPPLAHTNLMDISMPYKELELPYTRMHDCPLENANWDIVDFNNIFPFMHLDENDCRNYNFAQTDEYLKHCMDMGTKIYYRLGPSIEHHYPRYKTMRVPEELWDKWANVAANIIRHYNEGLWNGYHFGIEYWEVWCEPEGLWFSEDRNEFNRFYCFLATKLKGLFPNIKIGGPGHIRVDEDGATGAFLRMVKEKKAPLDFYSWHSYADNVPYMAEQPFYARELLDSYGFTKTELHLNEWHYVPGSWSKVAPEKKHFMYEYKMKDLDAGTFLCATLTAWQDTPLDMACYYTATTTAFGLFSRHGSTTKSYYCMKAFGQLMHYPQRLKIESNDRDVYVLAGQNEQGEIGVLITAFHVRGNSVYLKTDKPVKYMEQYSVNENASLQPDAFRIAQDYIEVPLGTKPAVVFLKMKF